MVGRNKIKRRRRIASGEAGFSIVETFIVLSMLMAVLAAVAAGVRSAHQASAELRRQADVSRVAAEFMDRLTRISFGSPGDPAPTTADLDELFDDDAILGSATLSSMVQKSTDPGFSFQMANFQWGGVWEVRVTADLNNDGDELDDAEGLTDIFRINIFYNTRLVLQTLQAAPFA